MTHHFKWNPFPKCETYHDLSQLKSVLERVLKRECYQIKLLGKDCAGIVSSIYALSLANEGLECFPMLQDQFTNAHPNINLILKFIFVYPDAYDSYTKS
jgi:hypothetical protein